MLKVMIVEDEIRIAELIRYLVDWESLGLQLVAEANNGLSALETILRLKPDIVITDIRMPGIDGIELIKRVRDANYPTIFVIISGYKEFEYAHSAMKYDIKDYLLKPINQSELVGTMEKLRNQILKTNERESGQQVLQNKLADRTRSIRREFLSRLFIEQQTTRRKELATDWESHHFTFHNGCFLAFILKIDTAGQEPIDHTNSDIMLQKVVGVVDKNLTGQFLDAEIAVHEWSAIGFIHLPSDQMAQGKSILKNAFEEAHQILSGFGGFFLTLGFGMPVDDFSQIPASFDQAIVAVQARVYFGTGRSIDLADYQFTQARLDEFLDIESVREFERLVVACDSAGIGNWVARVLNSIEALPRLWPGLIHDCCAEIVRSFFRSCLKNRVMEEDEANQAEQAIMFQIASATTLAQMRAGLIDGLGAVLEAHREAQDQQIKAPIKTAIHYICAHFREPIGLETVAEQVRLNPVYFSTVFKKELGVNFSDYVSALRLDEAKLLLRNSDKTIAEIAFAIGYNDEKYFSKTFRKTLGISPSQFRRLYC